MHFSLVIVGAHDGSKNTAMIDLANTKGRVLLIEPVPFLFARLAAKYGNNSNIILRNIALSLVDGEGSFLAPSETANTVHGWGDQLGSLLPDHAAKHDVRLVVRTWRIKLGGTLRFNGLRPETISS